MRNEYKILGVPETATETDIKQAYRKLAFEHHPDRNPGNDPAVRMFKEITEAYNTLINPHTYNARSDLERRVGLTKQEIENLDRLKLFILKGDYTRIQYVSKVVSISGGISVGILGSCAIYEQFNDSGDNGLTLILSVLLSYFVVSVRKNAYKEMKKIKRDIEILTKDLELKYSSAYRR